MPLDDPKLITKRRPKVQVILPNADKGLRISAAVRNPNDRKKLEARLREKQRLTEMGRMAEIFAHEIANPLQGISTALELIKETLPAEYFGLFDDLATEASHLESLLKQFRAFGKLNDLNISSVDLSRLVDRVVRLYRSYWSGLGIRVVTDFTRNLTIEADTLRLHQVIVNLSRNAVRSMPDGGSMKIKTCASGGHAVLEVSDTGLGIGETEAFEVFTSAKAQARGIGLYVVQQIVSAHGGSLKYSSRQRRGTTFRVSLPETNQRAEASDL